MIRKHQVIRQKPVVLYDGPQESSPGLKSMLRKQNELVFKTAVLFTVMIYGSVGLVVWWAF